MPRKSVYMLEVTGEQNQVKELEPYLILDEAMGEVLTELDQLTEFAIQQLNPFDTVAELEEFAEKIQWGADRTLCFGPSLGFGEKIQTEFILSFFRRFFPQLTITDDPYYLPAGIKVAQVRMLDFDEFYRTSLDNTQLLNHIDLLSQCPYYSMVQAKIIHSHQPSAEKVSNFKKTVFKQLSEAVMTQTGKELRDPQAPLLVGSMNPQLLTDLPFSFRLIASAPHLYVSYFDAATKTFTEEATLFTDLSTVQRAVYTLADLAVIPHDCNKMEGVIARVQAITDSESYQDIKKNSNAILDSLLKARGLIQTKAELIATLSSGTKFVDALPVMTEQDTAEIYHAYLNSPNRVPVEVSLKTVTQRILRELE